MTTWDVQVCNGFGKRLTLVCVILCFCALGAAWKAVPACADPVVLVVSDAAPYRQASEAFVREIAAHGHVPKQYALEELQKKSSSQRNALSGKASLEAMGLADTQVWVAIGTEAAAWLRPRVTTSRALVYCMVADPKAVGLTDQKNVYGVGVSVPLEAQFQLMRAVRPTTKTIGLLYPSDDAKGEQLIAEVRRALPVDWTLEAIVVSEKRNFSHALDELFERNIDWVWTQPDARVYDASTVRALLLAALRRKVPVFGFSVAFVRAGALIGVGVSPELQGAQAVALTERVLKGALREASTEQAAIEFAVNRAAAEKLGIELAPTLLERARHVFGWD